jgi:hypothetical protein
MLILYLDHNFQMHKNFENYGQDTKLAWMIMYGVSGLLIPASLSTALTITIIISAIEPGINNTVPKYLIDSGKKPTNPTKKKTNHYCFYRFWGRFLRIAFKVNW